MTEVKQGQSTHIIQLKSAHRELLKDTNWYSHKFFAFLSHEQTSFARFLLFVQYSCRWLQRTVDVWWWITK